MAIATSTAIGLGIAAVSTAASVGMNLSAAAKQAKAADAAQQAAEEAAAKAEAEYQKEFMGGVQLPMEAYEQAGREGTAQQMQSLQALQEADTRTLAAGVGKVQAEATNQQAGITEQMRQDLFSLEAAQAEEKQANRDQIAAMNQERAMGAQMAAADAEAARTNALASAASSVGSLAGQAMQALPLYAKGAADIESVDSGITPASFVTPKAPLSTTSLNFPKTSGYPDWSNNLSSFRFR